MRGSNCEVRGCAMPQNRRVRPIDFQFNYPLLGTEAELFAGFLRDLPVSRIAQTLLAARPGAGAPHHREAAATFLATTGLHAPVERVSIVGGGHHALTVAVQLAGLHGLPVAVDSVTYSNFLGLAAAHRLTLLPCALDDEGMLPDELAAAAAAGARAVYLMPTVHNPLGTVMPEQRRRALAAVAQSAKLVVLEDDAYAFLAPTPPPSFAALLPEQTFYVYSLSKPFAPLLKAAILVAPSGLEAQAEQAVTLGSSGTSLLFAEFLTHLIETGEMQAVIEGKRAEAAVRQRLAPAALLHCHIATYPGSYHLWVTPQQGAASAICAQAAAREVLLSDGALFAPLGAPQPNSFRLALGGEGDAARLAEGLAIVGDLLSAG